MLSYFIAYVSLSFFIFSQTTVTLTKVTKLTAYGLLKSFFFAWYLSLAAWSTRITIVVYKSGSCIGDICPKGHVVVGVPWKAAGIRVKSYSYDFRDAPSSFTILNGFLYFFHFCISLVLRLKSRIFLTISYLVYLIPHIYVTIV